MPCTDLLYDFFLTEIDEDLVEVHLQ